LPRDRVLTGLVRNDSLEVAEVEARELRVLDARGRELQTAGIFLGSFVAASTALPASTRPPTASAAGPGGFRASVRARRGR